MARLRVREKGTYYWRAHSVSRNAEGGTDSVWAEAVEIEARIWTASGQMQAEEYGRTLPYAKNMLYEGDEPLCEGDGICVDVGADETPDYRIESIQHEWSPAVMTLRKVIQ